MPKGVRPFDEIEFEGKKLVSMEKLMSTPGAHMGYSVTHIRRLARDGEIKGVRHRNRWFFDVAEVQKALTPKLDESPTKSKASDDGLPTWI